MMKDIITIPTVTEEDGKIRVSNDLFSRLLKDRIIMLTDEVKPESASIICSELLYLESQDDKEPISLYIDSPGGNITDGMAILDIMNFINAPVYTFAMGMAASMGAFLLSQGEPGHRYALPNAEIMIHQPLGGYQGQATDIDIHAKRIMQTKEKLIRMMAESTNGKTTIKKMAAQCERDNFLEPEQALEMGLIDKILTNKKEL